MAKPINEAKQLFEDMTSNNYHWGSERSQPKRRERHEIDVFTMLASKVNALFQQVIGFNLLVHQVVLQVVYMVK